MAQAGFVGGRNVRIEEHWANGDQQALPALADTQAGASTLGLQTIAVRARNAAEIDTAFAEMVRSRADSLFSGTDPVLLDHRQQIADLAQRHALPAISFTRPFVAAGAQSASASRFPDLSWLHLTT